MNIFGQVGRAFIGAAAESGQEKLGRFAYEVYRVAKRDTTEWQDLTQRQQDAWIGAAGDKIEDWLKS